jgi:hypothetical protein
MAGKICHQFIQTWLNLASANKSSFMKNALSSSLAFVLILLMTSCSKKNYLSRIKTYFNASDSEHKAKFIADDYHSFFIEKKGEGDNKASSIKSFQQWDAPLHPDIQIIRYTINKDTWTIALNEQNDFTKLIGFPGWKATEIITFNREGLIKEAIYIPDSNNPPYKKWLIPAVDWLQKNMPGELNEVYQNGKLIQTEAKAKKWVSLLKLWHKKTDH